MLLSMLPRIGGALSPYMPTLIPATRRFGSSTKAPDFSIGVKVENQIATVTFNRAKVMNALSTDVLERLRELIISFQPVQSLDSRVYPIRAMIFTGIGDVFVSGADINMFADVEENELRKNIALMHDVINRIENSPFPTLCAVNGLALGGGLELAFAFDFILAVDRSRLGLVEPSIGLIPGGGGTQRLYRRISYGHANEMLLTAEPIDVLRALDFGLVNRICSKENLESEALTLVQKMIKHPPEALAGIKKARQVGLGSIKEGIRVETEEFIRCWKTPEAKARINHYINKRRQK